ncbi:MAG: carbamoyl-phosphate synthase large subunit, partial [bacterium]|nr:carbamoyl-phosphate synthase large subunit [bacterium]
VMAIGRSFEEALQKAVRMLDIGVQGVIENNFPKDKEAFLKYITIPTPKRLFAISEAFKRDMSVEEVYKLTGIDPWFLHRVKHIVDTEKKLNVKRGTLNVLKKEELLELKQLGFSDKNIGKIIGKSEMEIRDLRKKYKVTPSVFQIDTLAGEFPAKTNYLYTTYHGFHHDVTPLEKKGVMVLGSGPYRIGSSVEFDWTCVNTALALKKHKKKSIIINCNPETVSTDYDISDRLYFEELTFERIADVYDFEQSYGAVVSVGGQTPNNVAQKIARYGIPLLGTKAADIDRAEDRSKFSELLDTIGVSQPPWNAFTTIEKAIDFASNVGYPVLIRPSYVLSGSAMNVCFHEEELRRFIQKATDIGREHPVIVSKFIPEAKEIEFDGVAEKGEVQVYAISEHIENAGVHSGDASVVYPPQKMYLQTERRVKEIGYVIAKALHITGPFNIQFVAKENSVQVIEVNLRASRTFPFISKVTGINFAEKIVDAFFGKGTKVTLEYPRYALVKVAQFSFARLEGADPILRVEMASTGEVACFGEIEEEAYLKALYSTGMKLDKKSVLLSLGGMLNKERFIDSARTLIEMGYTLYATKKTSEFLIAHGVENISVHKVDEKKTPTVLDLINSKQVAVVINLREAYDEKGIHHPEAVTAGYLIRRAAVDKNIPLFTDLNGARLFVKALSMYSLDDLQIKSWKEYK